MRQIDSKYKTEGDVTKNDGTPIPADEPLFLFRAKDKLVPELIEYYAELCRAAGSPEEHVASIRADAETMRQWQAANPDRVKIPD